MQSPYLTVRAFAFYKALIHLQNGYHSLIFIRITNYIPLINPISKST
jgi:hypothetical protein